MKKLSNSQIVTPNMTNTIHIIKQLFIGLLYFKELIFTTMQRFIKISDEVLLKYSFRNTPSSARILSDSNFHHIWLSSNNWLKNKITALLRIILNRNLSFFSGDRQTDKHVYPHAHTHRPIQLQYVTGHMIPIIKHSSNIYFVICGRREMPRVNM